MSSDVIPAYFVAGTLRGVCEDIIVLAYLQRVANPTRNKILDKWLHHDLEKNLLDQKKFFSKNRPYQKVLSVKDDKELKKLTLELQNEWNGLGWALRGTKIAPSTWALAKEAGIVEVYEYFYRFSCDMVHFNPGVALRFGWGDNPSKPRFSAKNFDQYYQSFALVYGAYLWCLLLHLLRPNLRPPSECKEAEKALISWLHKLPRWPEIVTFEELNMEVPKPSFLSIMREIGMFKEKGSIIRRTRKN